MKKNYELSIFYTLAVLLTLAFCQTSVFAVKDNKKNQLWQETNKSALPARQTAIPADVPVYRLNRTLLNEIFGKAPREFTDAAREIETILEIPAPDGGVIRFRIEESPMLAPEIAAQFPTWKQFSGQGIDDPTAMARFDINSLGFHGYVISAKGTFLIDPYSLTDKKNYIVYYKGDVGDSSRENFSCEFKDNQKPEANFFNPLAPQAFSNGNQLRNFRIAVSATKEYTNFFGGNVNTAFAGIQTTVNRMITIYRRDLATTFTLVSGTNTVFTNANDGGFPAATDSNVATLSLDRNQIVLDMIIGNANYEIGHVLSQTPNPNGLAQSPSLCDNTDKAKGFTGAQTPQGDGFDVDYVAHEIGHQFSMSHTFNNDIDGSCNTRSATSAYEPASGVTIMGYGGICAPRNLAQNSIEYFNLRSFDQSLNYLQVVIPSGNDPNVPTNCGTPTANGNTAPTVTSPGNFNIPRQTPFTLTAAATDVNGDALTYLWEEFDLGGATRNGGAIDTDEDGTARPIFRAYNASTSPSRTFPDLSYILNNANVPPLTFTGTLPNAPTAGSTNGYVCAMSENCVTGERLPSIARTMNFRVTVRDNRAGGGGVADTQSTLTVSGTAGPFLVTTQDTPTNWAGNSTQTVTWSVNNTNAAPINAANVKISLSTDGGQTFPTTILASTPNDGTEQITVPNTATTQARIKIEAVGNIFFDINNANFTITASAPTNTVRSDFDGDGKTDFSVFRPSEGNWYLQRSTSGFAVVNHGINTDTIAPADIDGDRKADFVIWRPSNVVGQSDFYVLRSTDSTFSGVAWGVPNDIPVLADYDGDNRADYAVWRPSTGDFYVLQSQTGNLRHYNFGVNGDKPVPSDFDGDNKADFAVFRPSNSTWYIAQSTNNSVITTPWGIAGDIPVFADYDGDNKSDVAIFRPSNGTWYIQGSSSGIRYISFGTNGDVPVPGDYDGDGKYDQAVYRGGVWYVNNSTSGFAVANFGLPTDVPTPRNYLPQ